MGIGDAFTGDNAGTGKGLAKGKKVLDAVLEELAINYNLSTAANIVLTGGSSGGHATYLVCDRVGEKLQVAATAAGAPAPNFACLADAGFFLDHDDINGKETTTPSFRTSFYGWNSSSGTNQECIRYYEPLGEEWKCIFAQYVLPFIRSRVFVMQNFYDSWQMNNILRLGCSGFKKPYWQHPEDLSDCNEAQMIALQSYGKTMRAAVAMGTVSATVDQVGVFGASCIAHCQSVQNEHPEALWHWPERWGIEGTTAGIRGKHMHYPREVFGDWFLARSVSDMSPHNVTQSCDWGQQCNPLCPLWT